MVLLNEIYILRLFHQLTRHMPISKIIIGQEVQFFLSPSHTSDLSINPYKNWKMSLFPFYYNDSDDDHHHNLSSALLWHCTWCVVHKKLYQCRTCCLSDGKIMKCCPIMELRKYKHTIQANIQKLWWSWWPTTQTQSSVVVSLQSRGTSLLFFLSSPHAPPLSFKFNCVQALLHIHIV
jgi:hypothetical protein